MDLRILHTADLHLDSSFTSFGRNDREKLSSLQRSIPEKLLSISNREKCNLWLIAGDVFDGKTFSRESVAALKRVFTSCNVPVFIAPGNHDFFAAGSPWLSEAWPDNVYIFKGGLEAIHVPSLDCIVYGAGFQSMDSASFLDVFKALGGVSHEIMVLHGDPIHVKSPYNAVTSEQVLSSGLDYIALGHVHTHGGFKSGKTLCAWPGCPMGRGWDETGQKGVYIATVGEQTDVSFHTLDLPEFHDVTLNGAAFTPSFFASINAEDFYRVTLTGKKTELLKNLMVQLQAFSNVEVIDTTVESLDPWELAEEDSFRGNFFRILREQLQDAQEDKARVIGLSAEIASDILSGIEVILP